MHARERVVKCFYDFTGSPWLIQQQFINILKRLAIKKIEKWSFHADEITRVADYILIIAFV